MNNLERTMQLNTQQIVIYQSEVKRLQKNMLAAYALWYFLGGFGAHRFYTKRKGSAIAQLILSVVAIVGIIAGYVQVLIALTEGKMDYLEGAALGEYVANHFGWILPFIFIGLAVGIWVVVDAFLVYRWVRTHNAKVEDEQLTKLGV